MRQAPPHPSMPSIAHRCRESASPIGLRFTDVYRFAPAPKEPQCYEHSPSLLRLKYQADKHMFYTRLEQQTTHQAQTPMGDESTRDEL